MNPIVVLLMNTSIPMSFGASMSKNVPDNIHIYVGEFLMLAQDTGYKGLEHRCWGAGQEGHKPSRALV